MCAARRVPAAGGPVVARRIEFFCFIGSTHSCLSVARADAVAARAGEDATRNTCLAATERARQLGIFGAPTFVGGQEIF